MVMVASAAQVVVLTTITGETEVEPTAIGALPV